jgi:hypothetical protein
MIRQTSLEQFVFCAQYLNRWSLLVVIKTHVGILAVKTRRKAPSSFIALPGQFQRKDTTDKDWSDSPTQIERFPGLQHPRKHIANMIELQRRVPMSSIHLIWIK